MTKHALASVWPPNAAAASKAGHMRMSPTEAIRRKCLDCSCHQPSEVRLCQATACPLWPFRAGTHPYTKRSLQEPDFAEQSPRAAKIAQPSPLPKIRPEEASFGQDGRSTARPSAGGIGMPGPE